MGKTNVSIFNDVLGPVITGPSSSNTAGALRVTRMMRELMPDFKRAVIYVDDVPGGFAPSLQGLKTGVAFAAGLLDFEVDDPRIGDARKIASEQGLSISYAIEHFNRKMTHLVRGILENDREEPMNALGVSLGGGMAVLLEINGVPVSMRGSAFEILLYSKTAIPVTLRERVVQMLAEKTVIIDDELITSEYGEVYEVRVEDAIDDALKDVIRQLAQEEGGKAFFFNSILTVCEKKQAANLPFSNGTELEAYVERTGKNLFEAAIDYEMARSGWSREEILGYAEKLVRAMRTSVEEGLRGDYTMTGYSVPFSGRVQAEYNNTNRLIPLGMADKALYYAMAVMELNSGMGQIVACPTAGSSGIVPAILLSMMDNMDMPYEQAVEGFMVAGLIGMIIATLAHFNGAEGGCQAEVASGCAMGASMACYLMGGTTVQILRSAVLSFEALMGLICDPIAKYAEVPCILRNPMGASVAFTMANMALCDYDPFIPLDEIIIAMKTVGDEMPPHVRCGCSGTCSTPTALKMKEHMLKTNVFSYEAE